MGNKGGIPRSRGRKRALAHPCGCYRCTGDREKYNRIKKLEIPKHKVDLEFERYPNGMYEDQTDRMLQNKGLDYCPCPNCEEAYLSYHIAKMGKIKI